MFEELYLYNFFPTEQGEGVVRSREIAAQKMFLIHNILGEDAKIFDPDEEPTAADLFKRINQNPSELEEESLLTQVRNQLAEMEELYPDVLERINALPARVKTAKASEGNHVVVVQKKGLALFIQLVADTLQEKSAVSEITFGEMLPLVHCLPEEPRLDISKHFWPAYEAIKAYRPTHRKPHTENALEVKATNNLNTATRGFAKELGDLLAFTRLLIRDIKEFHTLPRHTLRELAKHELGGSKAAEKLRALMKIIEKLRRRLGENYLDQPIEEARRHKNTIIIAVENQGHY